MILTCPACQTRYTINDAQMGVEGRTVRCASCKHTWHASKPQEPIELGQAARPERPKPEDLQSVKAKRLPHTYRVILEDKKRLRAIAVQGVVWAGMAAAMIAVLSLAYIFKIDVVRTFPAMAGAYASLGMKVNASGLQFETYDARADLSGGRFVVRVEARVKNLRDKPTPVPPVRVHMYDASSAEFNSRLIPANGLVVEPGATRTLVFEVADPLNLTSSLKLDFDLVAMKSMKDAPTRGHGPSTSGSGHEATQHGTEHDPSDHGDGHEPSGDHEPSDSHDAPVAHGSASLLRTEPSHPEAADAHHPPSSEPAHDAANAPSPAAAHGLTLRSHASGDDHG